MKKEGVFIGIIAILLLSVVAPFAVGDIISKNSSSEPVEEYIPLDPEFLAKPNDGSLPKDHSIFDNYRIAGGVLSLTENFRTEQTGNAISDMVIKNNQVVSAERIINGDISYATYLTTSSFVNKTNQRLYLEDKVLYREGKVDSGIAIYDENVEPYTYSYEYVYDNLGWVPREMSSYIINEDTIVSSRVVEDSSYPYTMEFILDNKSSIDHTKREVRYNADAISYPKYDQVKVTISLDNDWKVLEIKTDDIYDITVKMGISMTAPVNSKLVEKFYYDDYLISSLDSYSYFSNYFDFEINDEVEIEKEKTALDYILDVAFDVILNGSSFKVEGNVDDLEVNGNIDIKFNFTNMSGNIIGLFDDLYFKYDGNLYLSYLKHNYMFDSEFLEYILGGLNQGLVETVDSIESTTPVEDNDQLSELIESLTLVKDGNYVSVISDYQGMNVSFNFFEIEQGTILRNIDIKGNYDGEEFSIKLTTTSNKIQYEEKEYNDLSSSTWLIDELLEISSYQGYSIHVDYELDSYDLDVNINLKDDKVLLVFDIFNQENEKVSINLFYLDEKLYLELDYYIIEVEKEDIELLVGYIAQYLEDNNQENGNNNNESIEEQDILSIVYEVIDEVSMIDENHMNISLLLSKINENFSNTNIILSIEEENLNAYIDEYAVNIDIEEYNQENDLPIGKMIYSKDVIDDVSSHYKNIESLWNKDTIQLEINDLIITNSEGSIYVNGDYTKNNSNYCLELEFSNLVKMKLRIIYLNEKYYLSLGQDSYSVNLILNQKQMDTFIDSIDEVMDYILGENDFDASMEKFIKEAIDEIMKILSGESLDMTVGELIYTLTKSLDTSYVEVDERNIILEVDESKIQLYKLGDNYMLMVEEIEYGGSMIQGDITLKEREYEIMVDTNGFIDISTIFEDLGIDLNDNQTKES